MRVVLYRTFVSDKKTTFQQPEWNLLLESKGTPDLFPAVFSLDVFLDSHYFQLIRMEIELKLFKFNQVEHISTFSVLELSCVRSMHCQRTTCSPST